MSAIFNSTNAAESVGSANSIASFNVALAGTTSNGYALASLIFATQVPTGITVTIGGSSATELTGSPLNASTVQVRMYGIPIAALSGNLACSAAWTNNTYAALVVSVYDGVKQTSSVISPLSSLADTGAGSATPVLAVVGGTNGDMTVAVLAGDAGRDFSLPLQTSRYHSNLQFQAGVGVSDGARTVADVTHGWTDAGGATSYAFLGVNLIQSTGGGGPTPAQLIPAFTQTGGGYGVSYV